MVKPESVGRIGQGMYFVVDIQRIEYFDHVITPCMETGVLTVDKQNRRGIFIGMVKGRSFVP